MVKQHSLGANCTVVPVDPKEKKPKKSKEEEEIRSKAARKEINDLDGYWLK